MSNDDQGESELLRRLKAGDKQAADELLGRYFDRTVRAANIRIAQRRLRGSGSEDIAASVFESLWKKADQQQFSDDDLTNSDELWRLLCTMVRFKTEDHLRREHADKRGGGMVRGESVFYSGSDPSGLGLAGFSDSELTADELVSFREHYQKMMKLLRDETLQEVVTLRVEENKVSEIANHFGKSERWVKRKLALARDIWQQELDHSSQ